MTDRFAVIESDRPIGQVGTTPVQGGVEFNPPTCQGITKQGQSCTAPRALGTLYCIGHLRSKGGT